MSLGGKRLQCLTVLKTSYVLDEIANKQKRNFGPFATFASSVEGKYLIMGQDNEITFGKYHGHAVKIVHLHGL